MYKELISRDSKGKVRLITVNGTYDSDKDEAYINRSSGLLNGALIKQPPIVISEGKAKRTVKQQLQLQFDSWIKKYKDKGYKEVIGDVWNMSTEEINTLLGTVQTNQAGVIKPMLAKQADKVTNPKIFDKLWYASRKLDGVRCLIYQDSPGYLRTASRGGEDYDVAAMDILIHDTLQAIYKKYPNIILDGELYVHHKPLQEISGACRKRDKACSWLEYFIYDYIDLQNMDKPFKDRLTFLNNLKNEFKLEFDPEHETSYSIPIHMCPHIPVQSWDNIIKLHNIYVMAGYEGVVIRDPDKAYKPNGRTNIMIKVKMYKSEDFKVIGYEEGLRGSEDMVFICELSDGRVFKAMPDGNRAIKRDYVENFETKYKNHKAECTFFNYSTDGIPTQPKLRTFRFDLE